MATHPPPWDIYIDERKVPGDSALGCLAVPNTASFAHKLYLCRHHPANADGRTIETREVHWSDLHRGVLSVAKKWIDCVFQHRGVKFYVVPWRKSDSKETVIVGFISRFCRARGLRPPHNMVVFLDHDSSHAKARIQNGVREVADIARCYHLDGCKNDCLQCSDLLLGAVCMLRDDPTIGLHFPKLDEIIRNRGKPKNSEVRRYLAGYIGKKIDEFPKQVYDLRPTDPMTKARGSDASLGG